MKTKDPFGNNDGRFVFLRVYGRDVLLNCIESWNVVELMNRNCCFA